MTAEQASALTKFFEGVTPLLSTFKSSTKAISEKRFAPFKNYNSGLLEEGALLLPESTMFILDETEMDAGKVDGHGVHNIKALATLIES